MTQEETSEREAGRWATRLSPRVAVVAVVILTPVALALRVSFAGRSGLWRDEAQFLWIVRLPTVGNMLEFLGRHESHPPLFYLLERAWLGLFGDSEPAALALPLLLGVALIPVVFGVASRAFGPRVGLLAAVLATFAPYLVRYSGFVRPYSLMPLLCLLSVEALYRGLRGAGGWTWIRYAVVTWAMLLAHHWGWMVLAGEWAVVAAAVLLGLARPRWLGLLGAQAAIALGYAPWIPRLLVQVRHAGYDANHHVTSGLGDLLLGIVLATPGRYALSLAPIVLTAAVCRRAYAGAVESRGGAGDRLALLCFLGVPAAAIAAAVVLSVRTNLLIAWSMVTICPCLIVALASEIVALSRSRPALVSILAAAPLLWFYVRDDTGSAPIKTNAREVARAIADQARPTDVILVTPQWNASSFSYYYPKDTPQLGYPTDDFRGAIPYDDSRERLFDPERFAALKERLAEAHRRGQRVWLVSEAGPHADAVIPGDPDDDRLARLSPKTTFTYVGLVRSKQIQGYLDRLYGAPETRAVPPDPRAGQEILRVLLYQEPGGDPEVGPDPIAAMP